ncbi:MAG TPA: amino acid permease [Steroidobacteraceae bacterium]|jgi:AAT family amino acid transporter/GABA permease|nr:amino acid permease [Steroidobacteraceae bacterium]
MTQSNPPDTLPKNELSRSLKGRHLTMISIGGIIGAGLFVSSSTSILAGGPASFISYAITGLLILLVMRMLGEMTTALPKIRSFTEFARAGLGEGAGFVVGWLYWYFWVLVVPVEAIAGAKILKLWIPLPSLPIGIGLMTVMTCVNLMSARSYAEFEFWFASIKVAAILVFIAIATSYAFGWTAPHGSTFGNLVDYGGFTPHGWIAVLAAVPTVFFAMTGAEITTIAAAESAQPGRAVARMSSAVIGRILVFYVISLFLIVSVTPWNTVRSGESPFTLALNTMHVPWAGGIMTVIILTAVLSCMNSAFYVSSRVLFILAERGDAPQSLVKLNARRVPVGSVLMGALAGFLGIIAATQAPQVVFDFLVSSSGALVVFIYMAIAVAQITLRKRRERNGDPAPPVTMWLFPWLSYAAIAAMGAVLIAMAFTPGLQQDFNASCITLVVAVAAYLVAKRLRRPAPAVSIST